MLKRYATKLNLLKKLNLLLNFSDLPLSVSARRCSNSSLARLSGNIKRYAIENIKLYAIELTIYS